MANVIYIAERCDTSIREAHASTVPKSDDEFAETPLRCSERNPKAPSESPAGPGLPGWHTLASDPRFFDGLRRAFALASERNQLAQPTNARVLAGLILALACVGPVSEMVRSGSIEFFSTTMLGTATLMILSGLCWRFRSSELPPEILFPPHEDSSPKNRPSSTGSV